MSIVMQVLFSLSCLSDRFKNIVKFAVHVEIMGA